MKNIKRIRKSILEFMNILLFCLQISWKSSKLYTIIRLSSQLLLAASSFILVYVTKYILDILAKQSTNPNIVLLSLFLIIAYSLIKCLTAIINKLNNYSTGMHNNMLSNYTDQGIMKTAIDADLEFFDSAEYFDAFERVKGDSYSLINVLWNTVSGIRSIISLFTSMFILGQLNIVYCVVILLSSIPSAIIGQKYAKELYMWDLVNVREQRRLGYIYSTVTSKNFAQDLRQFNAGSYIVNKHIQIWKGFFSKRKKIIKKQTIVSLFAESLPEITMATILFMITSKVIQKALTVGDFTLYSNMMAQVSFSLTAGMMAVMNIYDDKLKIDNIANFSRFKNKTKEHGELKIDNITSIQFQKVCFTYPGTDTEVLKNISIEIEGGKKTAIVGVNGAGKSTLIKLLLRFYDVTKGQILINGRNICEYDLQSLRSNFSSYLQNSPTFAFSLRDNITISDIERNANDQDVLSCLAFSSADHIINGTNITMDTYLSKSYDEEGIELSGGQSTKIVLSRTFYRRANVLILDEPSASLDPEAEFKVFQALDKLAQGKTTIYTSHRLANVINSDNIIVIEEGYLVEQGSHAELMKMEGRYATLFNYQASRYSINN